MAWLASPLGPEQFILAPTVNSQPTSPSQRPAVIGHPPQEVMEGLISCCFLNMPFGGLTLDPKWIISMFSQPPTSMPPTGAQVSTAPPSSSHFQRYNIQHQLRSDTQEAVQAYLHCEPEPGSEQASLLASASSGQKGACILLWWVGSWCREWRTKLWVSHVPRSN